MKKNLMEQILLNQSKINISIIILIIIVQSFLITLLLYAFLPHRPNSVLKIQLYFSLLVVYWNSQYLFVCTSCKRCDNPQISADSHLSLLSFTSVLSFDLMCLYLLMTFPCMSGKVYLPTPERVSYLKQIPVVNDDHTQSTMTNKTVLKIRKKYHSKQIQFHGSWQHSPYFLPYFSLSKH